MAQTVHSLRSLESPSGTEMHWVLVWQVTHPEKKKIKSYKQTALWFSVYIRHPSSCCPLCTLWMNEYGWADSSITAAAFYITTSASAGKPCENPCARECRCFSSTQEGMGSAMANRSSMRRERRCDRRHTTNQWLQMLRTATLHHSTVTVCRLYQAPIQNKGVM